MSLPSSPSVSYGVPGNALTSQTLGAGATVNFTVDFSAGSLGGWVQVWNTGVTAVAGTAGLQVTVLPAGDNVPNFDTVGYQGMTLGTVVGTPVRQSLGPLATGKYQVSLKNLDATNGVTVQATSSPIS